MASTNAKFPSKTIEVQTDLSMISMQHYQNKTNQSFHKNVLSKTMHSGGMAGIG